MTNYKLITIVVSFLNTASSQGETVIRFASSVSFQRTPRD